MCRLFGLSGGERPVRATFWLEEAPDSLAVQSRREPDGTGIGVFRGDGSPFVVKRPIAAYEDTEFARAAHELESRTFVAHIRFASTGGLEPENTHPFAQDGRLFAHNGVIEDLAALERELGDARSLVRGDTDSERFFALVSKHARANGGDVGSALAQSARWVAEHLPVFALNAILTTSDGLWALRYPETHELWVLERAPGGLGADRHLEHSSPAGTIRVRAGELADRASVVVASERMDEDPGWRLLAVGELLHVTRDLSCRSTVAVSDAPAHRLALDDLEGRAAVSQTASGTEADLSGRPASAGRAGS